MRHTGALHERVLLVPVLTTERPRVALADRVQVVHIAAGMSRLFLRFGFAERLDVPQVLDLAVNQVTLEATDPGGVSVYIGRETIIASGTVTGMAVWREAVFALVQRNSERCAANFGVPARQVVEIGTEIEI